MFDMPLFPSFDSLCRRPCRPAQCQCQSQCRDNEFIVKVCGCDACGNLIVSIRRR